MSADFWAGYISGAVGIIIGNPLDVLKVKLQAGVSPSVPPPQKTTSSLPSHTIPTNSTTTSSARPSSYLRPFLTGTAAPVLGYGALNALLFVSYNRTEAALNQFFLQAGPPPPGVSAATTGATTGTNLYTTFLAGAVGGLATWVVSTPTELIKCRVQLASSSSYSSTSPSSSSSSACQSRAAAVPSSSVSVSTSSWSTTKQILRAQGIKGLYFGGLVTALRDSIGYGFYFWSYELTSRWMADFTSSTTNSTDGAAGSNAAAASVLLCGGIAGIVTWASIFPLDVIKTRVQTQALDGLGVVYSGQAERETLLAPRPSAKRKQRAGAWEITKQTYTQGGIRSFFRGLCVCSVRAFIVNAVQWAVYEWIMAELGVGRNRGTGSSSTTTTALGSAVGGGEAVL